MPLSSALPASAHQVWDAALAQLLLRVTRQNYDSWLRNTVGLRFEGTTLVVCAPNELACDWLSTRMKSMISQALAAVAGPGLQVRYVPADQGEGPGHDPEALQPPLLPRPQTPLNPRYTFATYLEAGFNRLALAAALDVAREPNSTYSPLFITGTAGNGKTHLLHAIAHEAGSLRRRVVLASAEQFLSEFTTAVRKKEGAAFRARYRELDLLLIDDAHLLLGKPATLNEFFQTIAGLSDQGRCVVIAGDLSAMTGDARRFHDQLRWGLVAPIGEPSTEDRIRFVKAKAAAQSMTLPDEVQHYLALRMRSSVRDLEGAVNRVSAIARISIDEPLDIDFAARALQPVSILLQSERSPVSPTALIDAVCRHLGVSPSEITSQKRNRVLSYARHLAMYLLREDGGLTYAAIAQLLGKKDHSTVVHACKQLIHELGMSPSLRADLDAVRASLHMPTHAA
jgi:chromosomal replication initiator protein